MLINSRELLTNTGYPPKKFMPLLTFRRNIAQVCLWWAFPDIRPSLKRKALKVVLEINKDTR